MLAPELLALDAGLARGGEDVVLQRNTGTPAAPAWAELTVRAGVRDLPRPEELVGGVDQTSTKVVLSPSALAAAGWPELPEEGWWTIIAGRRCRVEEVRPIRLGGALVRIELRVTG